MRNKLWSDHTTDYRVAGRRSTLLTHAAWVKRKITLVRAAALKIKPNPGAKRAADSRSHWQSSLRTGLPQSPGASQLSVAKNLQGVVSPAQRLCTTRQTIRFPYKSRQQSSGPSRLLAAALQKA